MSQSSTTAEPVTSTFGLPTFTKIGAAGAPLPAAAESWAAVRMTLGDQSVDVLVGNVGDRMMSTDEGIEACLQIDALGTQNWRPWTPREALACVDFERWNPAANPQFFPDIKPTWYITASPVPSDPDYAFSVLSLIHI